MRLEIMPPSPLTLFKLIVYTLLAVNIALFFLHRTVQEGLDSLGWVGLLAVFEWQSRRAVALPAISWERWLLGLIQAVCYALILYAWAQFYIENQWLDFINASIWLGVVASICFDLYGHRLDNLHTHWLHHGVKILLYAALFIIAFIWGITNDWLNFYDAALWIICFFAIEMNLLQRAHAHIKNHYNSMQ